MSLAAPRDATRWRRAAKALAWTLAASAVVHPLASSLAGLDWRADLLSHFREPAVIASLLASASFVPIRRAVAVGFLALAAWQGWGLALCSRPNPVPPDPSASSRLRVVSANLLVENDERAPLIDLVRRERPDVLGLIEVSHPWLDGLEPIRSEFPHRYEYPSDDDGKGLALWLRESPISVEFVSSLAPGGNPALHAVVKFAGKARHLWLVHLVSPLVRPANLPAGREFASLAERVRLDGGSTLVIGDCNSTDGSPYFARFLEASRLHDSRLGFGRQGSWPAWSPYRIAIDHAFLSPDLAVARRAIGPAIGSDHLPLVFELAPAATLETKDPVHASHSSTSFGSLEANLTRSARRRNATSRPTSRGSNAFESAGSSPISSVVFDRQAGPNEPINAPRTTSDDAIKR